MWLEWLKGAVIASLSAISLTEAAKATSYNIFNWLIPTSEQNSALEKYYKEHPEAFNKKGQIVKKTGKVFYWPTSNNHDVDGDGKVDVVTYKWSPKDPNECDDWCTAELLPK